MNPKAPSHIPRVSTRGKAKANNRLLTQATTLYNALRVTLVAIANVFDTKLL